MNISAILQLIYIFDSSDSISGWYAVKSISVIRSVSTAEHVPPSTKSLIFKTINRNPMRISTVCVGHPVVAFKTATGWKYEISISQEHLAVKGFFKWECIVYVLIFSTLLFFFMTKIIYDERR